MNALAPQSSPVRPNHTRSKHYIWIVWLLCLLCTQTVWAREIKIGVLSYRHKHETLANFAPLLAHLNKTIPAHHFVIVPCTYMQLESIVMHTDSDFDFILTNPSHYILLSQRAHLSAPLATLLDFESKGPEFGGVILTRADRDDINQLTDLYGKTIASVNKSSFGGLHVQAFELKRLGMKLDEDYSVRFTGLPHDNVVEQVLERTVDAGFIRTGVLESMIAKGKLRPNEFKVIHPVRITGYALRLSTPLYPEWPLVALNHVEEALVRHITATLLDVNTQDRYFFTSPSSYTPVEQVLQDLHLPPFDQAPQFTFTDIWRRYHDEILGAGALFLLIVFLSFRLYRANLKLDKLRRKIESEAQLRCALLNTMTEGVYGVNQAGVCIIANPTALDLLGYSAEELLGQETHKLFHSRDAEGNPVSELDCPILQTLHDQQSRACEDWFIRKSGEGFPVSLRVAAGTLHDQNLYAVVVFHDISKRKEHEEKLLFLANHDILTGLPNRNVFDGRLTQSLALAKRYGHHIALLYVDLDKFKPINDTYGHHVGDRVLVEAAQRMLSILRESDTVARIGGDEFLVLLPNIDCLEDATTVAQLLLDTIRCPYEINGTKMHLSASIGVAVDIGESCDEITLKNHADAAMYHSKHAGGSTVTVHQTTVPNLDWQI